MLPLLTAGPTPTLSLLMLEIIKSIIRSLRYDLRHCLYEGSTVDFPDCFDRELANGKQTESCTRQRFKNPQDFSLNSP